MKLRSKIGTSSSFATPRQTGRFPETDVVGFAETSFNIVAAIDVDLLDLGGDFSLTSNAVLRHALEAANREERGEVHIITVLPERRFLPQPTRGAAQSDLHALAAAELAAFAKKTGTVRIRRIVTHVPYGMPAREIASLAARLGARLVVLGSQEPVGTERRLLGSVATEVFQSAGCPVVIERGISSRRLRSRSTHACEGGDARAAMG